MRKRTAVLLSLVLAAAAGCNQKTETASSDTGSSAPTAAPATAPPAVTTASPLQVQPPPAQGGGPEKLVPRITVADLSPKVQSGSVVVIDVRAADTYISGHIPGALHIPLQFIDQEAPYLSRAKPIVTYCT